MPSVNSSAAQAAAEVHTTLSKDAQVLTDFTSEEFQQSMKRWSDVDVKIPSAIFKPACEADVIQIVKFTPCCYSLREVLQFEQK
jgi:hypothetical protein